MRPEVSFTRGKAESDFLRGNAKPPTHGGGEQRIRDHVLPENRDEGLATPLAIDHKIEAGAILLRAKVFRADNSPAVADRDHPCAGAGAEVVVEITAGGSEENLLFGR